MGMQKKTPIRRCIGCSEHFPKGELVRIVRSPEGEISLDFTGKKAGRGAYLCKKAACLKAARKARRVDQALSCTVPDGVYAALEEELLENNAE